MAIGLDIGSSAVRVAELQAPRRGGTPRLSRFGTVTLAPGAVVDGDVLEPMVVADALRELWRVAGMRGREVVVGLASHRVTVRQVDLPELPDAEIADAVRLQAQDHLPMPVDEAMLDYVVIGRDGEGDERAKLRLLLVAAEREMVERMLTAVTAAKLRPVVVDLDAFALLRSLVGPTGEDDEAGLVIDIGATVTKIAVHRGGHPLFVRMVRLGGNGATSQLQSVLDLPWDEAEKAKLDASAAMVAGGDLDPEDERARALAKSVERVITEVGHSLDFFRSQHDDVEVERVVLSGGGSLAPSLAERLHAVLELPVERGQPLRRVGADGHADAATSQAPFLSVPIGLAMALDQ